MEDEDEAKFRKLQQQMREQNALAALEEGDEEEVGVDSDSDSEDSVSSSDIEVKEAAVGGGDTLGKQDDELQPVKPYTHGGFGGDRHSLLQPSASLARRHKTPTADTEHRHDRLSSELSTTAGSEIDPSDHDDGTDEANSLMEQQRDRAQTTETLPKKRRSKEKKKKRRRQDNQDNSDEGENNDPPPNITNLNDIFFPRVDVGYICRTLRASTCQATAPVPIASNPTLMVSRIKYVFAWFLMQALSTTNNFHAVSSKPRCQSGSNTS